MSCRHPAGDKQMSTGHLQLNGFESQTCGNKKTDTHAGICFLAEDEGFEPPQTESESGVLPLHKSSVCGTSIIISNFLEKSSVFLYFGCMDEAVAHNMVTDPVSAFVLTGIFLLRGDIFGEIL